MKYLSPLILLLMASGLFAQPGRNQGPTLPTTCVAGQLWLKTGAVAPGTYYCNSSNTWVLYGTVTSIGVESFNTRTGAIVPQASDYSAFFAAISHTHLAASIADLAALLAPYAPLVSPTFTGAFDSSGATTTKPIKTGTTLPASCGTGEVFFDTDATAGSNVFTCISNTWTVISSGEIATAETGLLKILSGFYVDETVTPQVTNGSGAPVGACTGVRRYTDTTAHQEYYCEAGIWRAGGSALPVAQAGTIGGVMANAGIAGQFVTGINTTTGALEYDTPAGGGSTTGLYSGTLNFGAIPDLGCASLTLTATGLTTGKTLALSLPAALETGLIGTAFASAADTATVRLCNVSGVSVDPASATFAVRDMDALGYLTASATINFGVIYDTNCLASTITLSGASSGDNVAAGWPSGLEAGLTGSMFVSATDTVAVRVCNFSGAAVDPASATFKAAITR